MFDFPYQPPTVSIYLPYLALFTARGLIWGGGLVRRKHEVCVLAIKVKQ